MNTSAETVGAGRRLGAAGELARCEPSLESVEAPKICLMRFVLALSALLIIFLDSTLPVRFAALTYVSLLVYTLYSGYLLLLAEHTGENPSSAAATWIDVACYSVFIAVSGGAGSIFFFFFFFSILVASFRDGFASGFRVALASALLYSVVAYFASSEPALELSRFLLRPVYLLILGYMIAVWGGSELTMKRRLALLRTMSRTANPRFGVDHTVGAFMEEIRGYFDADTCLLVTQSDETMEYSLRRADRYKADRAATPECVVGGIGCQLTSLMGDAALAVTAGAGNGAGPRQVIVAGDREAGAGVKWFAAINALWRLIGHESFVTVPWHQRGRSAGRVYITSRGRGYGRGDLEFLRQVVGHAEPLIENFELMDRLATMAAEQERRRISRDLHDSTIQPYIGFKMGLESVCRKYAAGAKVDGDLTELLMRTELGLADLRRYVHGLKWDADGSEELALTAAVWQYAEQFTTFYGIRVTCEVEPGLVVGDRLAAEAFQIVREGLSNVHRHTGARAAAIRLSTRAGSLVVELENDAVGGPWPLAPFTPRSIRERSEALGGKASVDLSSGRTLVRAEIPL
jgi:signal transduction histidine kinase